MPTTSSITVREGTREEKSEAHGKIPERRQLDNLVILN
jgi:hypothetical protein